MRLSLKCLFSNFNIFCTKPKAELKYFHIYFFSISYTTQYEYN